MISDTDGGDFLITACELKNPSILKMAQAYHSDPAANGYNRYYIPTSNLNWHHQGWEAFASTKAANALKIQPVQPVSYCFHYTDKTHQMAVGMFLSHPSSTGGEERKDGGNS